MNHGSTYLQRPSGRYEPIFHIAEKVKYVSFIYRLLGGRVHYLSSFADVFKRILNYKA